MALKKYTEDSIKTLSPRDFCRLRPATYLGSNEYSTQLLIEIFSNALDEHTAGRCNNINVKIDTKTNTYQVDDDGQGFIVGLKKKGSDKTILQSAFDDFNTSGKYDEHGSYSGSLGLNGIGAKLTNFLSKWLIVRTSDGKGTEKLMFRDGILSTNSATKEKEATGTSVTWVPDEQFFQNPHADITAIKKLFKDISALCPALTITLEVDGNITTYHAANGLQDLLDDVVEGHEILGSRFIAKKVYDDGMLDVAMTFSTNYSETVKPYVNYGLTESGLHVTILKALMAKHLNKFALKNKLIKNENDFFTATELSEGMVLVFNLKCNNVKYDSQTKNRVVDCNRPIINDTINSEFPVWIESHPKDARLIIERAATARKAKEAAQNARDKIRGASNKSKKFINLPTKLVDAYSKNRSECELYVCEGDSAGNGLIAKRDGKTQAVFPIRGKIISCRKAAADKVYANQEVSNIVKAIGLEIDKDTGKLIYDPNKLRYGKIILSADADSDGAHIVSLLINMFWWLCPELVTNGHLYRAVPPLYRVTTSANKYIYLTGESELNKYKKTSSKYIINRLKGLGEMDPSELADCVMRSNTRSINQILVEDIEKADNMLELIFGDDVSIRRDYMMNH